MIFSHKILTIDRFPNETLTDFEDRVNTLVAIDLSIGSVVSCVEQYKSIQSQNSIRFESDKLCETIPIQAQCLNNGVQTFPHIIERCIKPNGDIIETITTYVQNAITNDIEQVTYTNVICNIKVKDCGCPVVEEENIKTLCDSGFTSYACDMCKCDDKCNVVPVGASGYITLTDDNKMYISSVLGNNKIYLKYIPLPSDDEDEILIPDVMEEYLIHSTIHYAHLYSANPLYRDNSRIAKQKLNSLILSTTRRLRGFKFLDYLMNIKSK